MKRCGFVTLIKKLMEVMVTKPIPGVTLGSITGRRQTELSVRGKSNLKQSAHRPKRFP